MINLIKNFFKAAVEKYPVFNMLNKPSYKLVFNEITFNTNTLMYP
jgi:hypothetical protein